MMMKTGNCSSSGKHEANGLTLCCLVQLHHLFVELLAVAAVLLLQLAQLGLQLLHLEHALGRLELQRRRDQHHDQGDHRDREDVVVGEVVELGEQPGGTFEQAGDHRTELRFRVEGSGTGSHPDGPKGRQRRSDAA